MNYTEILNAGAICILALVLASFYATRREVWALRKAGLVSCNQLHY